MKPSSCRRFLLRERFVLYSLLWMMVFEFAKSYFFNYEPLAYTHEGKHSFPHPCTNLYSLHQSTADTEVVVVLRWRYHSTALPQLGAITEERALFHSQSRHPNRYEVYNLPRISIPQLVVSHKGYRNRQENISRFSLLFLFLWVLLTLSQWCVGVCYSLEEKYEYVQCIAWSWVGNQ